MTFSKLIPVLCALGMGAIGFAAQAEDNPAQAAARMALAKQLFEVNGTNAPAANTAPVVSPAAVKADKAAAAAKAKQDAAQAKADKIARQEAEKKLAAQQAADAKVAAEQAKAKAEADKAAKSQASQKSDADRAALSAAMAERMNTEAQAKKTAPAATSSTATTKAAGADQASKPKKEKKEKPVTASAPAPQKGVVVDNAYAGQDIGMKQIAAPALPISSSKAERLQSLLEKYKADQITPDEYHQQRAAILAEP